MKYVREFARKVIMFLQTNTSASPALMPKVEKMTSTDDSGLRQSLMTNTSSESSTDDNDDDDDDDDDVDDTPLLIITHSFRREHNTSSIVLWT